MQPLSRLAPRAQSRCAEAVRASGYRARRRGCLRVRCLLEYTRAAGRTLGHTGQISAIRPRRVRPAETDAFTHCMLRPLSIVEGGVHGAEPRETSSKFKGRRRNSSSRRAARRHASMRQSTVLALVAAALSGAVALRPPARARAVSRRARAVCAAEKKTAKKPKRLSPEFRTRLLAEARPRRGRRLIGFGLSATRRRRDPGPRRRSARRRRMTRSESAVASGRRRAAAAAPARRTQETTRRRSRRGGRSASLSTDRLRCRPPSAASRPSRSSRPPPRASPTRFPFNRPR